MDFNAKIYFPLYVIWMKIKIVPEMGSRLDIGYRERLSSVWITIIKERWSQDHPIFKLRILISDKSCIDIEIDPRGLDCLNTKSGLPG